MSDWYDTSKEILFNEAAKETNLSIEQVKEIYSFLSNIGLIDYDIEKEILYDRYVCKEEE